MLDDCPADCFGSFTTLHSDDMDFYQSSTGRKLLSQNIDNLVDRLYQRFGGRLSGSFFFGLLDRLTLREIVAEVPAMLREQKIVADAVENYTQLRSFPHGWPITSTDNFITRS